MTFIRLISFLLLVLLHSECFADDSQTTLPFINPRFNAHPEIELKTGIKTVNELQLTNGGLFLSLSDTQSSRLVMIGTEEWKHPNPLRISHCGLIILEKPSKILSIIDGKISGQIPSDYPVQKQLLEHLKGLITEDVSDLEKVAAFCYAIDGFGNPELSGSIIRPVSQYLDWKQNFFIRNVRTPYPRKFTRAFIRATLGMPKALDSFWNVLSSGDSIRLFMGMTYGLDPEKYVPRMWCSEQVARFYGFLRPCSLMPSQFSSVARDAVIGRGLFCSEIPLSISYDFTRYSKILVDRTRRILFIAGYYDPS